MTTVVDCSEQVVDINIESRSNNAAGLLIAKVSLSDNVLNILPKLENSAILWKFKIQKYHSTALISFRCLIRYARNIFCPLFQYHVMLQRFNF